MKDNKLLVLFSTFFKIGLFTFGGGYAMLPFIEKEMCEKHKFITSSEILDIFSISECTPGPISINCATFIGYKINGFCGALVSTLGVILPSFMIITIISIYYNLFKEFTIIIKFLNGIKVGVIILLSSSVIKLISKAEKSKYYYIKIILILLICVFSPLKTISILFLSIFIYIIWFLILKKNGMIDL